MIKNGKFTNLISLGGGGAQRCNLNTICAFNVRELNREDTSVKMKEVS